MYLVIVLNATQVTRWQVWGPPRPPGEAGGIPGGGRCNLGHFLALKDYDVAQKVEIGCLNRKFYV